MVKLLSVIFHFFLFVFLANSENGFYSSRNYRVPSAVEFAGNSVLKVRMKSCSDSTPISLGSAFVVESSSTLWTAKHVIQQKENLKEGDSLCFELYSNVGTKLFDTDLSSDKATIEVLGTQEKIESGDLTPFNKDFSKIKLSRPLDIKPIELSSAKISKGQNIYSIGYPELPDLKAPDSTSQMLSIMQSRATIGEALSPSKSSPDTLLIEMDGYPGQSGSPFFNEEGQAIGILCGIARKPASVEETTKVHAVGPSFEKILAPTSP